MQRIILSEDTRGIEFLQTTAQTNLQTLRRINELAPELNSEEKILAASAKPRAIILQKFFLRFPEAERQSQYSKIEFAFPPDLEELQRLLTSISPRSFELVCWDKKSKGWAIDETDLAAKSDKYRTFIENETELKIWEAANRFCQTLNEIGLGTEARKKFINPMFKIDAVPGKGFQLCPDPRGVKLNYQY